MEIIEVKNKGSNDNFDLKENDLINKRNMKMMYIDEPTSGLDSNTIEKVNKFCLNGLFI